MPIGNSVTSSFALNSQAGQLAVTLRDTCHKILSLQAWVTQQGSTGLQAIGFTAADATAFITEVSYLNTVALIFTGVVQQGGVGGIGASQFNFENAVSALTGPS
jgi:hypothetical protein